MPNTTPRPLSPHLSIYKWQITMVLSILHRMTGVALYVGTLVLLSVLYTVAYAPENFAALHECLKSPISQVLLFGWTFAFYLHLLNGIRHLFWDMGKGFDIKTTSRTGWLVLVFTLFFTLCTWATAYQLIGAQ